MNFDSKQSRQHSSLLHSVSSSPNASLLRCSANFCLKKRSAYCWYSCSRINGHDSCGSTARIFLGSSILRSKLKNESDEASESDDNSISSRTLTSVFSFLMVWRFLLAAAKRCSSFFYRSCCDSLTIWICFRLLCLPGKLLQVIHQKRKAVFFWGVRFTLWLVSATFSFCYNPSIVVERLECWVESVAVQLW